MPTGYTSIIEDHDDVTFEQYLWRCARAFGAFIMQREDALDAAVSLERKPDGYYEKEVLRLRKELRAAEEMTLDGAALAMAEDNAQVLAFHEESKASRKRTSAQYDRMRAKVRAWEPPTPEHAGLKKFMLEQLETGHPSYMREPGEPPKLASDPAAWRAEKIEQARDSLLRTEQHLAEEVQRCKEATAWIQALHAQVPWVAQPRRKL